MDIVVPGIAIDFVEPLFPKQSVVSFQGIHCIPERGAPEQVVVRGALAQATERRGEAAGGAAYVGGESHSTREQHS